LRRLDNVTDLHAQHARHALTIIIFRKIKLDKQNYVDNSALNLNSTLIIFDYPMYSLNTLKEDGQNIITRLMSGKN